VANILYVGTLPPHPGGTAIVGYQILCGLAKRGHQIRAIAPATPEVFVAGDPFASAHRELGITRFEVADFERIANIPPTDNYRLLEGAAIRDIFGASIAASRPEVVVIGRESYAWHVPDLARAAGIPSLLIIQGGTFHAIVNDFSPAVREAILDQFRKVDRIVSVAKHLAGSMHGLGFSRVTPIPNPVDVEKFYRRAASPELRRRLGISAEQPTIAYVANLRMLKRPMDVIDSAATVVRRRPDAVFIVIGDGDCRAMMEDACAVKSLARNFRFTGWIDHDLMPEYLNLADLVIVPSETEGLALVYLEAQACERVLIASDIPAAREVIEEGVTGFRFPTGDVARLSETILRVADEATLRATIGRKARASVMKHDLPRVVEAYESIICELA
jgi:phosphatidylinositol alpha-1,6-mannosyltransferase